MYRVYTCLTVEHDWRLVVLAVVVCLFASLAAINLFHRSRAARGRRRMAWLVLAGAATGCGIWATHFIAMLAFEASVALTYDAGLTVLSLVAAAAVTFFGLAVAVHWPSRWAAPLGGATVGAGIAVMHYTGMFALKIQGYIVWDFGLVTVSIVLGVAFGAAALTVAARRTGAAGTAGAAGLLTLAIASHHFVAMGAAQIASDPTLTVKDFTLSETILALAIAAAAMAILGISLVGALADSRLADRARQFARTRNELIADNEQKLREQNLLLDAALNNMSQGLCMFDADERIVVFNRRYLEMYRLSPQVVKAGCTLRQLLDHRKEVGLLEAEPGQYYRQIVEGMRRGQSQTRILRTTSGRYIQAMNQPMPGGGWVTTHEDITEQRNAADQIREQKLHLDTALDNMRQGHLMFDGEMRMLICNRRYLEMYGLSAEEVPPGITLQQLLELRKRLGNWDGDPPSYVENLKAALAKGEAWIVVSALPDGRIISTENRPVADGRWVSSHDDITEQRHAEERLREQKLRLDAALDNMSQGLLMFDNDARLMLCNQRYLDMYELDPQAVRVGMSLVELLELRKSGGTFPRDPQQYVAELRQALSGGDPVTLTVEQPDGRTISVGNQPMPDGRWVSTHEDVTARRRAEIQLRDQKLQLDTALNNMSQGLNMFDSAGRLVVRNERYLQMYRLDPEDAKPGCTVGDLVRARIASGTFFDVAPEKYIAELMASMHKREPTSTTMELTDGRSISVVSQPTPDGEGWVVTHEDITERRSAEIERDRSQAFASTVIESVPTTILVKDARDLRYVLVNRAGEDYFGVSRDILIGKRAEEIFSPDIVAAIAEHEQRLLETGEPQLYDEHPVVTPAGERRIVTTTRVPIRDPQGEIRYLLTVVDDRTQRKRAEAQLAHMAHHDALTGLPNRAAFDACIEASIENADRDRHSFALMCINLDRFKGINDVFGHSSGDTLLREVSTRLQSAVGGAFIARLGGDEFTVIASDGDQPAAAEDLADKMLSAMDEDFEIDGRTLRVGMSVGVAIYPADGGDAATLVANANAALYRAKAEGRGAFRFFEPNMDKRLRERRVLQQDLRRAIERGELTLHYQPQARIDRRILGFEALVRWIHPQRGIISPGTFIPIAEESGLIGELGEWILREACREAATWSNPLQIAINLSPVQFRHGDLPGLVHSVLMATGLPPSRLELEITEGVLIDDFSRAVSILRRLKMLGVCIAMDDFGTGYSSLSYLQSFPFDKIKIDQAFISNLERNSQSATIVRAVIGIARGLKVPVLAEGVETKEQLAFLAKESCDEVQGFLIGRPRPIADYSDLTGKDPRDRAAAV
jgi:diguanylate cyclase (GGDEF)-like protein/PAS domain S-box-containing protein